jgi:hypothetical protein
MSGHVSPATDASIHAPSKVRPILPLEDLVAKVASTATSNISGR